MMCGIVGSFSFRGKPVGEHLLMKMRDTMVHRGPNGAGIWVSKDRKVAFGHRRLSIIDLSEAAAQPMCNEDATLWIAFNGEIYNHAEIKSELQRIGNHRWRTDHSDTEVILHAFEQWGIHCLEKFRGMFAIALWDEKRRELWLIRDRIGIKPLYYSLLDGRFNFASEIKALLEDSEQKRAVDEEAFFHYLSFLTTPAPLTLFAGIKKLPAGTWLNIKENGQIRLSRYWDVLDHTRSLTDISEEEIAERILSELRAAVKLRKVSDVPVGVFLSGGIDSSTNAALFSEGEQKPIKTFTIGYEGEYPSYPNELQYARQMATQVGADHHERILTQNDLLDFLPHMVHLQDEPIADPVCVPIYYVSQLARKHGVIVCQVGEGADELFCGYSTWKRALQVQSYNDLRLPRLLKKMGLLGLRSLGKGDTFYYEWLRRGALEQPIFWGGAEAFTDLQKRKLLSHRLREKFANLTSWEMLKPIRQRFEEKAWEKSHLHWMTYIDLNMRLPELLLMRIDKMSMGVSLEGRVPFLDHKLVELAMSIPASIKTKNGTLKYILKKAVRGLIPDVLIDRKKQGFGVPIYEWFFDQFGTKARQELREFCQQTDFLNSLEIERLVEQGRGPQVWYLLNFALWWKEFLR
jgi:asparagine synthase (glutamine-hydrolysing)